MTEGVLMHEFDYCKDCGMPALRSVLSFDEHWLCFECWRVKMVDD